MGHILSEKTRLALKERENPMPGRMETLLFIAEHGPCRKCQVPVTARQSRVLWLSEAGLIVCHGNVYEVTTAGRRWLNRPSGDVVPPPSRQPQPRRGPTSDEVWPHVRPERLKAFEAPSLGVPT